MNISPTSLLKDTELETVVGRLMPLKVYTPDLTTTVGKLKHLRHVVERVPPKQFDMNMVADEGSCGTVGCMIGWAGVSGEFASCDLSYRQVGGWRECTYEGELVAAFNYADVAAAVFDLRLVDANWLFTSISHAGEPEVLSIADGLARIDRMISKYSAGES